MLPLFERHVVSALELRTAIGYRRELVLCWILFQDFGYLARDFILIVHRDVLKMIYDVLE